MTLNNSKTSSSPTSTDTGSNNAPTDPFSVIVDGSAGLAVVRNCNNKRIKLENPIINLLGGTELIDMVNAASETLETVKRLENGLDGVKKTVDSIVANQFDKSSVTQGISQSQTAASHSTKEDRDSKDFTPSLSRDIMNPGSPNVAEPTSLPENDMFKTINQMYSTSLSSNPGSVYPSTGNESQNRGSGFVLSPKAAKDVKLPKSVQKDVKAYMLSNMDGFGPASKYAVRLWDPYCIFKNGREVQPMHCMVGDVGRFRSDGGFDVKFNIFLSKEENVRMKYDPPPTFEPLVVGAHEEVQLLKNKVYSSSGIAWDTDETSNGVFTMKSTGKPKSFGMAVLVVPYGCEKEMMRPKLLESVTEYFNNNLRSWHEPNGFDDLRDGSWDIIIAAYRSTVWGGAGLRKSKYQDSLQPVLQAQFKRADSDQRDFEWEATGTHSSFQCTQSHNGSLGDVPCTIAIELLSITRESLSSRMSSSLVSAVSTLGSILSLGHRSKE